MPKTPLPSPTPPECKETLGLSPAALSKRDFNNKRFWCPNPSNLEYDRYSDPNHPKTILHSHVMKANELIKEIVQPTPLLKSKRCDKFDMDLYFKLETVHKTGSFHERSAIYTLHNLTPEQRKGGVYTASLGNWAMALAYQGNLLNVPVTVVLPVNTALSIITNCQNYGATVVLYGKNVAEAKRRAFQIIAEEGRVGTYLNGYDHPHVIAGAGTIGVEILHQLPETEAILVPVGGGGLLAGISAAVKSMKPDVLIYGMEPGKACCFTKAMDNERPYSIEPESCLATSLTVPRAGENTFHTARSLVDKLVLVHDDWTARAVLHLIEEEKLLAEGAGAISLGGLMCLPDILPELHGKKVVSIVSGANIDPWPLKKATLQGKAAEGRVITITICSNPGEVIKRNNIFKLLQHMQCNILHIEAEREWFDEDKLVETYITLLCETKDFKHANTVKDVIEKLIPNTCEFSGDCFKLKKMCKCFPKAMKYL